MSRENEITFHVSPAGLKEAGQILTLLDGMRPDSNASFVATDEQGSTHEVEIPGFALEMIRKALMLIGAGETVIVLARSNPGIVLATIGTTGSNKV